MHTKRVISGLCFLILFPGVSLSVLSSHTTFPSRGAPQTPQTATLTINEYLADPAGSAAGDLAGDANGDGVRDAADDEFVEVVNNGPALLYVGLFTISDATQVRFTFPAGKVIPPGEAAVVFGGGTPTGAFGNATANGLVFTAAAGGLSLNNGGDTITIKDNLATAVTSVTFGSSEGGANQSITRSPDMTGGFTTHSTAPGSGGALFSPGARVNGAPFTTTDPVIASISPEGAIAGEDPFSMTVDGVNFVAVSSVRVNGNPVPTSFVSAIEIVAQIPLSVSNSPGIHLITVQNPGGAISNAVPFTVLGQIGFNEYLADPPDGLAGDANGDGARDSSQDEFVEIVNRTGAPIEVSGFSVSDGDAQRFVFPPGALIPAGEAAVIFGGGSPQGDFGNTRPNGLLFTASLSLNNGGDTLTLKNSFGATLESITYGSSDGNANQSINRNPDLAGIAFASHSSIAGSRGRLFSPGTFVNGSPFSLGPRVISIAPDNARKGALPFDMNVTGSGFEGGSQVLIDSHVVTTAFVDPGHLVARVPASVTAVSGPHTVQARNEGGNRSNSVILKIIPPPPVLSSITPRVVVIGSGAFTFFVIGLNFGSGAAVLIDGMPVSTTVINAQDLRASAPATVNAAIGTHQVTVRNIDGQLSAPAILEVIASPTLVTSITPTTAVVGGPGFMLIVKGANFKNAATVLFDGEELATTLRSATELSAQAPAALISTIGVHRVSVRNVNEPESNEAAFQVLPDAPSIESLDPSSVIEGAGEASIAITGEKFQPGAIVRVIELSQRGAPLDTTFLNSQSLRAKVPAALTQASGSIILAVENPDFGLSNPVVLKVLIKDPLVINEYLADPADGLAGDANGDGTRSSSADEFVELLNRSGEPFDISGYKLLDADAVRHVFAAGTIVPPFEAVVVFGGGTPTGPFGNAAENRLVFKASTGGLSLNNGGDTITLQDGQGRIVQEIKFGAAEGGAGQSINRDPDGDGATFTLHAIVAADGRRLFSPGARAAGQTFTIKPFVSKITPPTVRVGSIQFTLTVSGGKFLPGAVVLLGVAPLPTVFRSDTQLEALVAADMIAEGGAADVRVKNPRGELSATARLLIVDDPPRISRVSPQTIGSGAPDFEVSVAGDRFQRGAIVRVQGQALATSFISPTLLTAIVPSALFSRAADLPLSVLNTDGNASNAITLTVENGPLITRLSQSKIKAGSGAFELSVGGVAFKQGVILFANDVALRTTFVSDASLTARIPGETTNQPGVLILQARQPDGGRSNTATLKVK
jgi:hypothetical protein